MQDWLDTWRINNQINLALLEAIPAKALSAVATSGGRSVARQFAHIYTVRRAWIEPSAPDLVENLAKVRTRSKADQSAITHDILRQALMASGEAMGIFLERGFAKGKISGFKSHPTAFLGYLLAHEGYHRGEIGIILTQGGYPLPDDVSYGLWNWDQP